MNLRALLLPEPRRHLPHARWANVLARTVHLASTGTLLGGHVFGAATESLLPWLLTAIVSGMVMLGLELYTSFDWLTQLGGLFVVLKLMLLCVIPFVWSARVPILFAVVAVAGIGSHMAGKYRHYSLLYGRSVRAGGSSAATEP
jgi:hypothetical protein